MPLCGIAARMVQTVQPAASNVDWITGPTVQSLEHMAIRVKADLAYVLFREQFIAFGTMKWLSAAL